MSIPSLFLTQHHRAQPLFVQSLVDFLVLETLRVFEADLYEALFQEKSLLLQESRYRGEGRMAAVQEAANKLLEIVPEERRNLAQDTIKALFPPLEWALGGANYGEGFHQDWLAAKQICTARFFPRYFELQTATGEMSERRFIEFLEAASTDENLAASIAEIEADGLLRSLVARLDESVGRLPVEKAAVLLPGMFMIAQKFVRIDVDPFSSPWVSAWRATSWYLKGIPEEERGHMATEALRATKGLSVAGMLIHLNDPADHKDVADFSPALDLNTVEAMKAIWLHLIRSRATNTHAFLAEPDLVYLLYRWKHFAGSIREPREWMSEAIRTDEGFARMAKSMMSSGRSHTAGDRVSKVHYMFSRDALEDFVGLDVARARCQAIDPDDFPEYELPLATLRNHLDAWLEGKGELIYI
ncbi:hypothetical protein V2K64_19080 [Pseudomonas alliivorans]|nr:hypothetical protein [Pseudomonas alliivorans]